MRAQISKLSNDIVLHVKEVEKRGLKITKKLSLADFDTRKNEIIEELKSAEYNDFEEMVYRMKLKYSEIEYILDMKYIDGSSTGYTVPPGIYEIIDFS